MEKSFQPMTPVAPHINLQLSDTFRKKDSGVFKEWNKKSCKSKQKGRRCSDEVLKTILMADGAANGDEIMQKFLEANIAMDELSCLTETDLELMGFESSCDRRELLTLLEGLPNQEPSLEDIYSSEEARSYNKNIIKQTISQLDALRDVTATAKLKRMIKPPKDVLVTEKEFASSFVIKALAELQSATDKIEEELDDLELLMSNKPVPKEAKTKIVACWMLFGTVATAVILAAVWKFKRAA